MQLNGMVVLIAGGSGALGQTVVPAFTRSATVPAVCWPLTAGSATTVAGTTKRSLAAARLQPPQPPNRSKLAFSAQWPGQDECSAELNAHAVPRCAVVSLNVQSRHDGSQTDGNRLAEPDKQSGDPGHSPTVRP